MQDIIEYQEIDAKLRKLESELRSSSNRKNAGDMQQYLKDGQAKLVKLEALAKTVSDQYNQATSLYNEFVNKLEALAKEAEKIDGAQMEALAGTLSKLSSTAENLDSHIAALQNKIVSINKEVESLMNNAKKAKHNLEIYKMNYNKEKEKVEPEINKLKAELEIVKKRIKPELLAKYTAKSEGKVFPVFVNALNGNKCGGCRMEISARKKSALKDKVFIECENCGRIIYLSK